MNINRNSNKYSLDGNCCIDVGVRVIHSINVCI